MKEGLTVRGLCAAGVLHDIDLDLQPGALLMLVGRNGAGRSMLARALMGLVPVERGRIEWRGQRVDGQAPHRIARLGVALVSDSRDVFPLLTVEENLVLGCVDEATRPDGLHRWYAHFPSLRERRDVMAAHLSGGEQQMLAIARAMMSRPGLLILDEPSEGLSTAVSSRLIDIAASLLRDGVSVIWIESKRGVLDALAHASGQHRAIAMVRGRIVRDGELQQIDWRRDVHSA